MGKRYKFLEAEEIVIKEVSASKKLTGGKLILTDKRLIFKRTFSGKIYEIYLDKIIKIESKTLINGELLIFTSTGETDIFTVSKSSLQTMINEINVLINNNKNKYEETNKDDMLKTKEIKEVKGKSTNETNIISELIISKKYFQEKEEEYNLLEQYRNYLNVAKVNGIFKSFFLGIGISLFLILAVVIVLLLISWILHTFVYEMNLDIFIFNFLFDFLLQTNSLIVICIGLEVIVFLDRYTMKENILNTQQACKKLEAVLLEHYNKFENCPVGYTYSNPRIIQILIDLITSGRASNVKEAINTMLDDEHKQSMLNLQTEAVINSKKAANSASTTNTLLALLYFKKR